MASNVANFSSRLLNFTDGKNFHEHRYALVDQGPFNLGSLSLGWSGGSLKVYWTKFVGQEGCLDWDVGSVIQSVCETMSQRRLSAKLKDLLQGASNQIMPCLGFDWVGNRTYIRPHSEGTKFGFAIITYRSVAISVIGDTLKNLLQDNYKEIQPFESLVFRRHSVDVKYGEIIGDLLFFGKTDGSVFIQFSLKFLFDPYYKNNITQLLDQNANRRYMRQDLEEEEPWNESKQNDENELNGEDNMDLDDTSNNGSNTNSNNNNNNSGGTTFTNKLPVVPVKTNKLTTKIGDSLKKFKKTWEYSKMKVYTQKLDVTNPKIIALGLVGIGMSVGAGIINNTTPILASAL